MIKGDHPHNQYSIAAGGYLISCALLDMWTAGQSVVISQIICPRG